MHSTDVMAALLPHPEPYSCFFYCDVFQVSDILQELFPHGAHGGGARASVVHGAKPHAYFSGASVGLA